MSLLIARPRVQFFPAVLSAFLLLLVAIAAILPFRQSSPTPQLPAFEALPLAFVPNEGQYHENVRWHAQGHGGALAFYENSVGLRFSDNTTIHLEWEGANSIPVIQEGDRLEGVVNYVYGNDLSRWRTNVPTYKGIIYNDLYSGISLEYDGTDGVLKGTYTVATGIDPSLIRWRFDGAAQIQVNPETGDLHVTLPNGRGFVEQTPIAWQEINGQRHAVATQYAITDETVSFAFPDGYDTAHPLVIDPALIYSTYLGEVSTDYVRDIAVDSAGNVYVVGQTYSDNLGGFPHAVDGQEDAFVAKLNVAGTAWQWVTYLGGSDDETGYGLAVSAQGAVWMTGSTGSNDFPTTPNANQSTFGGFDDVIVVRLNGGTGAVTYSTYYGEDQLDEGRDIALDAGGNAYITGQIHQANVLALKYMGATNPTLVYGVQWGDDRGHDIGYGVAVDSNGKLYVTGMTDNAADPWGSTFPIVNAIQPECGLYNSTPDNCTADAFVSVLNAAGDSLDYSTLLGGGGSNGATSGRDEAYSIVLDGSGNMIVSGVTYANDFPTYNAAYPAGDDEPQLSDAWVTKLSANGQSFLYSTYLGGAASDVAEAVTTDTNGNAYVTGYTGSDDFPVLNPIQDEIDSDGICYNGSSVRRCYDSFVTKLNAAGQVAWSTFLGGSLDEYGLGIARDTSSVLYIAGYSDSANYPTTAGSAQPDWAGNEDGFISKVSEQAAPPATATATTPPTVTPGGPSITPSPTGQPVPPTVTPGGPMVTPLPTSTPDPNLKKIFLPLAWGKS